MKSHTKNFHSPLRPAVCAVVCDTHVSCAPRIRRITGRDPVLRTIDRRRENYYPSPATVATATNEVRFVL
ncbi:hypothetical protein PUN28_015368 [Cardiocondyla obscurior]|uniref:Uncharacterized protein n=1 Tax=Cardiocondyla obscurior TaxID=286306 RepID=A0AAW2EWI6_9HYME